MTREGANGKSAPCGARSSQKPLRAPLAIRILHVIRDVIYPYVSHFIGDAGYEAGTLPDEDCRLTAESLYLNKFYDVRELSKFVL